MIMSHKEKIIHATNELLGKGNYSVINEVFSEHYLAHVQGEVYCGHYFVIRFIEQLRLSIPDLCVKEIQFLTQKPDSIAWQRTLTGTHQCNIYGIPASGRNVEWREMIVTQFKEDKISEERIVSELRGELLMRVA